MVWTAKGTPLATETAPGTTPHALAAGQAAAPPQAGAPRRPAHLCRPARLCSDREEKEMGKKFQIKTFANLIQQHIKRALKYNQGLILRTGALYVSKGNIDMLISKDAKKILDRTQHLFYFK